VLFDVLVIGVVIAMCALAKLSINAANKQSKGCWVEPKHGSPHAYGIRDDEFKSDAFSWQQGVATLVNYEEFPF